MIELKNTGRANKPLEIGNSDFEWLGLLKQHVHEEHTEADPEVSNNLTSRPRQSLARPGLPRHAAYPFRTKKEVWGYNLTKLYQEAASRQWSSATDIPWNTIQPLSDELERAQCQLATFFAQVEFVAADVPGRFVSQMSPDYQEVRMFLLSQMMDESRHLAVFRKRALANGGGLMRMVDTVSDVTGGSTDTARDFTEMSSRLHLVGEGNVLTLFRLGELMSYNIAEQTMYQRAAQDEARHVAFGVLHARYMTECAPDRLEELHTYLDEAESRQVSGAGGDNPAGQETITSESLAILLGGSTKNIDEGKKLLMAIRQRQVREYFQRLKSAGLESRIETGRVNSALMAIYKGSGLLDTASRSIRETYTHPLA